ncbi:hypothetical protein HO976_05200 [Streptococcus suis]|nr:hypothetical protein [Streptococcus suis]
MSSADCASTGLVEASIASVAALASASTAFLEASFSASDKFGLASMADLAASDSLAILFLASCLAASRTSWAIEPTPLSSADCASTGLVEIHLYPCRTQQLSPRTPEVVGGCPLLDTVVA